MKNMKKILAGILSGAMMTGTFTALTWVNSMQLQTFAATIENIPLDYPGYKTNAKVTFSLTEEESQLWDELSAQYAEYGDDLDAHQSEIKILNGQWKPVIMKKLQEEIENGFLLESDIRWDVFKFKRYGETPTIVEAGVMDMCVRGIRLRALTYNTNVLSVKGLETIDNMWTDTGCVFGDCNSDGEITAADASIILNYAAQIGNGTYKKPIDEFVKELGCAGLYPVFADASNDGIVGAADASILLAYAAETGNGSFTGTLREYLVK